MTVIDRYLGAIVLRSVGLTLFVLLSINFVFALIDELDGVNQSYTLSKAAYAAMLQLPSQLFESLPAATLIGCLVGMGGLTGNSELTIIRGVMPVSRILWAVSKPVLLVMVLGLLITEYLASPALQWSDRAKTKAKSQTMESNAEYSVWARDQLNFVYIQRVNPSGDLKDVFIFEHDASLLMKRYLHAKVARHTGGIWQLSDVSEVAIDDNRSQVTHFDQLTWRSSLTPKLLEVQAFSPSRLSPSELAYFSQYLSTQKLDDSEYRYLFWDRILQPLTCLSLMLLSFSFVYRAGRHVSIGLRIFQGILIGISLDVVKDVLGQAAIAFGAPPLLMVTIPIALITAAGLALLRR